MNRISPHPTFGNHCNHSTCQWQAGRNEPHIAPQKNKKKIRWGEILAASHP
jgi:hypothetical protein